MSQREIERERERCKPFQPGTGLPAAPMGGSRDMFNPAQVELIAQPVSVNQHKRYISVKSIMVKKAF